jgi:DHA2 family multidrug resistance protein
MLAGGAFLILAAVIRHLWKPNPVLNIAFLVDRNILILGFGLFSMRFVLLSILVLVPGYLGTVQGYRPLETGKVLLWLAIPVLVAGVVAARLMKWIDARLVAVIALCTVAAACLMDARLTSDWAQAEFWLPQLVLATGLAFLFVVQIGMTVQQAIDGGGLARPSDIMTFAAFYQTCRLFGGQIGVSVIQHFIKVRATFHSSILARSVEAGQFLTVERLQALSAGLAPGSSDAQEAQGSAMAALAGQLSRQALTLTYADGFVLLASLCAGLLVAYACMKPVKKNYFATKQMALES